MRRSLTIGLLGWLVAVAVAVRVAADRLTPVLPLLVGLLVVAVVIRRLWRGY